MGPHQGHGYTERWITFAIGNILVSSAAVLKVSISAALRAALVAANAGAELPILAYP